MPGGLERPTLGFDLISKGSTLYEWVVTLELCHAWISISVDLEQIIGSLKRIRALLEQLIVSDSCNHEVTLLPEGESFTEK